MDSYFGKEFRDQLYNLNKRNDSEHDLPSGDCCQNKENSETLLEVKYVSDMLESIYSSALENTKGNEIIPSDMREKLHQIPQLPDEEVRTAIDEVFVDNFCDGPSTSSCSLGHSTRTYENNKSSTTLTTDCSIETCLDNNINFRNRIEICFFSIPLWSHRTED